jgi:hypothetical protein
MCSPADPSTLFVAAEDGLYRLGEADAATEADLVVDRIDARASADVDFSADGGLWTVVHPSPEAPTTVLYVPRPLDEQPLIHEYTDDTLADTMVEPETILVLADGTVLVGGLRSGTLRGVPAR